MIAEPIGEPADDLLEGHRPGIGGRPLETDHVGDPGQPFDHGARQPEARPERVVDDQADIRGIRRSHDVLLEVTLGVPEIERRRHLEVVRAGALGRLRERDQLASACRLTAHRDRHATRRFVHDRLGDRHPFVEAQRREVSRCATGEEDGVAGDHAAIDQEPHVLPDRAEIHLEIRVVEHGGDGHVAALEAASARRAVHGVGILSGNMQRIDSSGRSSARWTTRRQLAPVEASI